MIYTVKSQAEIRSTGKQLSFEDFIGGFDEEDVILHHRPIDLSGTVTYKTYYSRYERAEVIHFEANLRGWLQKWDKLKNKNREDLYYHFSIPKAKGGYRQIDAPVDELKMALTELKEIIEEAMHHNTYHTAAFAYVGKHVYWNKKTHVSMKIPGRSTIDCVRRHQKFESNFMLKTDFSDFFGSTNFEYFMGMLKLVDPFFRMNNELLRNVFELCFLNGKLPQGTPISPMLTNLIMIPIDYEIYKQCSERKFIYTRYADDIYISSKERVDPALPKSFIEKAIAMFDAPYIMKPEKTRYVSRKGKNWILGVMWNAENNITIGAENKKKFKAMMYNLLCGVEGELNGKQIMGLASYYRMVEPAFVNGVIEEMQKKFPETNVREFMKSI